MAALWIALVVIAVVLACIALAIGLAWGIGAITSIIQNWRHRDPDFRQRKRTGRGRSE